MPSSDLDATLPYSQGIPTVNNFPKSNSTDDLYSMERFLEEGVLPRLFKKPKKDNPLILGLQSQSPTSRVHKVKPPQHLSMFVDQSRHGCLCFCSTNSRWVPIHHYQKLCKGHWLRAIGHHESTGKILSVGNAKGGGQAVCAFRCRLLGGRLEK